MTGASTDQATGNKKLHAAQALAFIHTGGFGLSSSEYPLPTSPASRGGASAPLLDIGEGPGVG